MVNGYKGRYGRIVVVMTRTIVVKASGIRVSVGYLHVVHLEDVTNNLMASRYSAFFGSSML